MSLLARFIAWSVKHGKPDHLSGYMDRWVLVQNKLFSVRLHHTLTPDMDRHLHDHPWVNLSIILSGGYVEALPTSRVPVWEWNLNQLPYGWLESTRFVFRYPGTIVLRPRATDRHQLWSICHPCWSLFITGPRTQQWGFYTANGKIAAYKYPGGKDARRAEVQS